MMESGEIVTSIIELKAEVGFLSKAYFAGLTVNSLTFISLLIAIFRLGL